MRSEIGTRAAVKAEGRRRVSEGKLFRHVVYGSVIARGPLTKSNRQ